MCHQGGGIHPSHGDSHIAGLSLECAEKLTEEHDLWRVMLGWSAEELARVRGSLSPHERSWAEVAAAGAAERTQDCACGERGMDDVLKGSRV